jgi:hypothetical protein
MVCYFTKIAHFAICHKEIITKVSTYLFNSNFYRSIHGVRKVIVFEVYPSLLVSYLEAYWKIKHQLKYEYCSTSSHRRFDGERQSDYANTITLLLQ